MDPFRKGSTVFAVPRRDYPTVVGHSAINVPARKQEVFNVQVKDEPGRASPGESKSSNSTVVFTAPPEAPPSQEPTTAAWPQRKGTAVGAGAILFGLASALRMAAGLVVFVNAKSAVHEIEGLVLLLISAIFGVGSVLAAHLRRLISLQE